VRRLTSPVALGRVITPAACASAWANREQPMAFLAGSTGPTRTPKPGRELPRSRRLVLVAHAAGRSGPTTALGAMILLLGARRARDRLPRRHRLPADAPVLGLDRRRFDHLLGDRSLVLRSSSAATSLIEFCVVAAQYDLVTSGRNPVLCGCPEPAGRAISALIPDPKRDRVRRAVGAGAQRSATGGRGTRHSLKRTRARPAGAATKTSASESLHLEPLIRGAEDGARSARPCRAKPPKRSSRLDHGRARGCPRPGGEGR